MGICCEWREDTSPMFESLKSVVFYWTRSASTVGDYLLNEEKREIPHGRVVEMGSFYGTRRASTVGDYLLNEEEREIPHCRIVEMIGFYWTRR